MEAHLAQIKDALGSSPRKQATKALLASQAKEQEVVDRLNVETKHQTRVDEAVGNMAKIDGPADPPLTERDPLKRAEEQKRERTRVCAGMDETGNCFKWLRLEPVDAELKAIDVEVSKRRRTLTDAELREAKAKDRAHPEFNPANLIGSLVGPYQIQQTVVHWIDYDRDVDQEQVDRCQTCHMGSDAGTYKIRVDRAAIPHPSPSDRALRVAPHREVRMHELPSGAGPRDRHALPLPAGTSSRSSARSAGTSRETTTGMIRCSRWGACTKIVVDENNDEFAVKIPGLKKFEEGTIKLDHKSPEAHAADEDVATEYKDDAELFGAMQAKIQELVAKNDELAKKWHAVVRKVDNRVEIGLDPNDPGEHINAKDIPVFALKITKPELGAMLGWPGAVELSQKQALYAAPDPPSVPIRSDGMGEVGDQWTVPSAA